MIFAVEVLTIKDPCSKLLSDFRGHSGKLRFDFFEKKGILRESDMNATGIVMETTCLTHASTANHKRFSVTSECNLSGLASVPDVGSFLSFYRAVLEKVPLFARNLYAVTLRLRCVTEWSGLLGIIEELEY